MTTSLWPAALSVDLERMDDDGGLPSRQPVDSWLTTQSGNSEDSNSFVSRTACRLALDIPECCTEAAGLHRKQTWRNFLQVAHLRPVLVVQPIVPNRRGVL
jgi:hypothetical protein